MGMGVGKAAWQQLASGSDERGGPLSLVVNRGAPDDGGTVVDEIPGCNGGVTGALMPVVSTRKAKYLRGVSKER